MTKPFAAAIILQLAAEGRLRLSDPVERWLPGRVPNGRAITMRELLGHTSGLFDYDDDGTWVKARIADPARTWTHGSSSRWRRVTRRAFGREATGWRQAQVAGIDKEAFL